MPLKAPNLSLQGAGSHVLPPGISPLDNRVKCIGRKTRRFHWQVSESTSSMMATGDKCLRLRHLSLDKSVSHS